jgi:hypothetical protein
MQPMQPVQPVQPAQPAQPVQPAQPGQPGQQPNPLAGLAQAMGQMAGQMAGQPPGQGAPATAVIPWQSLSQALPTSAPGWQLQGQVEGQSAAMMGINVAEAKCTLKQAAMTADITLVDTTFNPMLAMPFTMMQSVKIDSTTERTGPVQIATHQGVSNFQKQTNRAQVLVMVGNRILATVEVSNAGSEAPAVQLAQQINFAHLASLMGG